MIERTLLLTMALSLPLCAQNGLTYHHVEVFNTSGEPVSPSSVTIFLLGTDTPATIYNRTGLVITNPMTSASTNTTLSGNKFNWVGPDGWDYRISTSTHTQDSYSGEALDSSRTRIVMDNAADKELYALAWLTSDANQLPYFTGSGTADMLTLTELSKSFLEDANSVDFFNTLGINTFIQSILDDPNGSAVLTTIDPNLAEFAAMLGSSGVITLTEDVNIVGDLSAESLAIDGNDITYIATTSYWVTRLESDANEADFKAAVNLESGTDFIPPSRLDDTKGNGDTSYFWSADKVYDQLTLKQGADADLTDLADGTLSKSTVQDSTTWDTAYGWGNHASAGYQAGDADLTTWACLTPSTYFQGLVDSTDANNLRPDLELGMFNVKDYPYLAKGDGVADDTAAIAAASAATPAGGVLFFPKGRYLVTSRVTRATAITWTGVGAASVIVYNGADIGAQFDGDDTTVQAMRFEGLASSGLLFGRAATLASPQRNLRVLDCTFAGTVNQCVWLWNVDGVRVQGCTFNTGYSILSQFDAASVSRNVIVAGNHFEGWNATGVAINHHSSVAALSSGWVITGNTFDTHQDWGGTPSASDRAISCSYVTGCIITNNRIRRVESTSSNGPVHFEGASGEVVFANNYLEDCKGNGWVEIIQNDGHLQITGNVFHCTGGAATGSPEGMIHMSDDYYNSRLTIVGNRFSEAGATREMTGVGLSRVTSGYPHIAANRFDGLGAGVWGGTNARHVAVMANSFYNCNYGVRGDPAAATGGSISYWTVSGNRFDASQVHDVFACPNTSLTSPPAGWLVTGNQFSEVGIDGTYTQDFTVSNNVAPATVASYSMAGGASTGYLAFGNRTLGDNAANRTLSLAAVSGPVVVAAAVSHSYGGAAVAWAMTTAEAAGTLFTVTNAGGAADAVFPVVVPGKMFTVTNASGQAITFKVSGQTGAASATGKYSSWVMNGTDCVKIYEQP